jgi:mannose-6-phosphate isomerase-like protein (cupin superfamily)
VAGPLTGHNRRMAAYTKLNFKQDVEDMAPRFGLSPGAESRFARVPLELEQSGLSYFKLAPGFRFPFGHSHGEQEEVYVVIGGSAVVRLDEEEVELQRLDAVRIPRGVKRALQGGPEGGEILAFGAPNTDNKDIEMLPGWWGD